MREIKFRIWDKQKKKFFEPIYEAYKRNLEDLSIGLTGIVFKRTLSEPSSMIDWQNERWVVNQFTGLLDKNGKEIYENDIVRILYTDWPSQSPDEHGNYAMSVEDYMKSISSIGYVAWDNHSTGWILKMKSKYSVNVDGTVMSSIIHGTHGEREVIGNMFENPEMVNV